MVVLTITSKGQVTLKKDVMRHLGVSPGDKITLDQLPGGEFKLSAKTQGGRISDVFNSLKRKPGSKLTIEDMSEVIAQSWSGKR